MTRRPEPVDPQLPVFIDESGWRRRTLQGMALVVGCGCLGYLLFVGTMLSGLRTPVGTHPPSTNGPASSAPDHATSPRSQGHTKTNHATPDTPAGHEARHHRPPGGRSVVPPAGGAAQ
ncbi:hypothetical protein ABZ921_22160 [Streptomyces atriruber]|uniref:Translation initiation factor IF-2 n=1 Tax=Streptomyces atriruber TaxID=545121 RepID=A0ABV3BQQ3_9ACTN